MWLIDCEENEWKFSEETKSVKMEMGLDRMFDDSLMERDAGIHWTEMSNSGGNIVTFSQVIIIIMVREIYIWVSWLAGNRNSLWFYSIEWNGKA